MKKITADASSSSSSSSSEYEQTGADIAFSIIFTVLYVGVAIVSVVIIAIRRKIFPGGIYPKVTVPMYTFTATHGLLKLILQIMKPFLFKNENFRSTALWPFFSLVELMGYFVFYCMFWYQLMTWAALIYPPKSARWEDRLNNWRFFTCSVITIFFLLTRIVAVVAATEEWTTTFQILESAHFLLLSFTYVMLTVLYIAYRKRLVVLIRESQLSDADKAHRLKKLSRILVVLLLCLDLGLVFMLYVVAWDLGNAPAPSPLFSTLTINIPQSIADCSVMYYFSPLQIYKEKPIRAYDGPRHVILPTSSSSFSSPTPRDDVILEEIDEHKNGN